MSVAADPQQERRAVERASRARDAMGRGGALVTALAVIGLLIGLVVLIVVFLT